MVDSRYLPPLYEGGLNEKLSFGMTSTLMRLVGDVDFHFKHPLTKEKPLFSNARAHEILVSGVSGNQFIYVDLDQWVVFGSVRFQGTFLQT